MDVLPPSPTSLDPLHWEAMLALGERRHYRRGDVLFGDRTIGDELFVVVQGPVEVLKPLTATEELRLGILEDGMMFGERCLFGDRRRSAMARAYGPLEVIAVPVRELERYLAEHPDFALEFFRLLCERFSRLVHDLDDDVRSLHLRLSFT